MLAPASSSSAPRAQLSASLPTPLAGDTNPRAAPPALLPLSLLAVVLTALNLAAAPSLSALAALLLSLPTPLLARSARPASPALMVLALVALAGSRAAPAPAPAPAAPRLQAAVRRAPAPAPATALEALERVQLALPNAGDVATEARENALDETRADRPREPPARALQPPNLNGTFIVNTHTDESCADACARYNYLCAPEAFRVVNSCQVLILRLSCAQCFELPHNHSLAAALPASLEAADVKAKCFTLAPAHIRVAQCQVSAQNTKRLCPCVA